MRVLLVGGGGREHAVAVALSQTPGLDLFAAMANESPGIAGLSKAWIRCPETDIHRIAHWAAEQRVEWAFIGPDDPIALGICDELEKLGIASVGPKKAPARLESSKLFARQLMEKHDLPGRVEFLHFQDADRLAAFLGAAAGDYALKPDGLTGGKGVKVMGVHLESKDEAVAYGREMIETGTGGGGGVIVEERLAGEEFTLQCFVDGETVSPMPAVRDFKRAFEGDRGPNTGGMGSYSQADGLLPFLSQAGYDTALDIVRKVVQAVKEEGAEYKGILYGQFMLTPAGVKLVEFNARLGDPEAINVIPLLQTGLADICAAIMSGSLDKLSIGFDAKAAVCKYVVPPDYGMEPKVGVPIRVDSDKIASLGAQVFYARVNRDGNRLLTTMSRSVAILGLGESITQAEYMVEQALQHVHGDFYVRRDIGKLAGPSPHTARDRR